MVGTRPAFINLTREFITGELPLPVSATQVGVEIPHIDVDQQVIEGVAALAEQGFTIVVDRFEVGQSREALLEYATYVKVNMLGVDRGAIQRTVARAGQVPHVDMIAYRLQDPDAVLHALDIGFNLFQGNALGAPHVLTTQSQTAAPRTVAALRTALAGTEGHPGPNIEQVAALIDADQGLTAALRNLATRGPRRRDLLHNPTEAVRHQGMDRLASWAALLAEVGPADVPSGAPANRRHTNHTVVQQWANELA